MLFPPRENTDTTLRDDVLAIIDAILAEDPERQEAVVPDDEPDAFGD